MTRLWPTCGRILVLSLLFGQAVAEAQQAVSIPRIGVLALDLTAAPHLLQAFRQGLNDLGYVEGRNVALEIRNAEAKRDRLPALAAELVALKVDVIFAGGQSHAQAAKRATKTIPIVFVGVPDPVESGLVRSLARPGGNVTGFSSVGHELVGKRLELLKQAVPGVNRVAVLRQHGDRTGEDLLKETREAEVSASAEDAASVRRGARSRRFRQGPFGNDWGARERSDCLEQLHLLQ